MQPRGRAGQQNYEESTQCSFSFFSQGKGGGTKRKDRGGKNKKREGIILPEFIVAGCGRTVQGVYRERERQRSLTRRGGGRKASSNLIRDLFCLSSSTLQKFFFLFVFLQMSGFRTSWDPRRTLASGPRLSQTWGNPPRCSCPEPETNRYEMFGTRHK